MSHIALIPLAALAPGDAPDHGDLHKLTMRAFQASDGSEPTNRRENENILWRLDGETILLRSDNAPTNLPLGSRTRDDIDFGFETGDTVAFRVAVNAIARNTVGTRRVERTIAAEGIPAWLDGRFGDALHIESINTLDIARQYRKGAPLIVTTVAGIARVGDPDALKAALRHGVGRGKAFGCGLLTVLPA